MNAAFILNVIYFVFAVVGAVDYLFDNKYGIGAEFERGICCSGKLIIAMTGFMSLSSFIGHVLSPVIGPVFSSFGADPSDLAGMILATDAGGAALAEELAINPIAAEFNGYFVGTTLGAAVMCLIPLAMLSTSEKIRLAAIYGMSIGLFSIPFGCVIGGLLAGYDFSIIFRNLIPMLVFSAFLFICFMFFSQWVIRPFQIFGKILVGISLTGLLLTTAKEIFSVTIIDELNPFSDIINIIGNIALVLSGVFPLMAVVSKILKNVLEKAADLLKIDNISVSGLLISGVNPMPIFDMMNSMTPKGALINAAFMIGANCAIGDFFAFTCQTKPKLVLPLIIGKMLSAILALIVAVLLADKLLKTKNDGKCKIKYSEM